ncbi:uncharacterized protein MELLADRAFT_66918 [Melampsora larici-populina 98AG31]|uniref:Uncharacterized protein n=1 Tax=Melampsora larici-populina (strain 98AG31 / pathotype 3-4-7) TaxID=747676 RepID=F4S139_MELLP|nr:uncharacterized protein MELLADRAFT_66918 [Melampsora larici-populina 98AG31]EGG01706.1 hypothetical protein MELLADRAFT_66918 [Melampsora larici-populina 98AG31]
MNWLPHTCKSFNAQLVYYLVIQAARCMEYHSNNALNSIFEGSIYNGVLNCEDTRSTPINEPDMGHGNQDFSHLQLPTDVWSHFATSNYEQDSREQLNQDFQIQPDISQTFGSGNLHMWQSFHDSMQGYENDTGAQDHLCTTDIGICHNSHSSHVNMINKAGILELDNTGHIPLSYMPGHHGLFYPPGHDFNIGSQLISPTGKAHVFEDTNSIHLQSFSPEVQLPLDPCWNAFDQIIPPTPLNDVNIYNVPNSHSTNLVASVPQSFMSDTIYNPILEGGSSVQFFGHQNFDTSAVKHYKESNVSPNLIPFHQADHNSHILDNLSSATIMSQNEAQTPRIVLDEPQVEENKGSDHDGWDDLLKLSSQLLSSSSKNTTNRKKKVSEIMRMEKCKNLRSLSRTEKKEKSKSKFRATNIPQAFNTPVDQNPKPLNKPKHHVARRMTNILYEQGKGIISRSSDLQKSNEKWLKDWRIRYQISIDNLDPTRSVTQLVTNNLDRVKGRVKDGVVAVFLGLVNQIDRFEKPQISPDAILKDSLKFIHGYMNRLLVFDIQSLQEIDLHIPLNRCTSTTPMRILHELSLSRKRNEIKPGVYYHIWKIWRSERCLSLPVAPYRIWFPALKYLTLQKNGETGKTLQVISRCVSTFASKKVFDRHNSKVWLLQEGRICIASIMKIEDEVTQFYENLKLTLLSKIKQVKSLKPHELVHYTMGVEASMKLSKLVIVPTIFGAVKMIVDHHPGENDSLRIILQDVWEFLQGQFSVLTTFNLENIFWQPTITMENIFEDLYQDPQYMPSVFGKLASGTFSSNFKPIVWSLLKKWSSTKLELKSTKECTASILEGYNDTNYTEFVEAMLPP